MTSPRPHVLALAGRCRPHRFDWGSAPGTIYLVFLGALLLTGVAGLATLRISRGRSRTGG